MIREYDNHWSAGKFFNVIEMKWWGIAFQRVVRNGVLPQVPYIQNRGEEGKGGNKRGAEGIWLETDSQKRTGWK